MQALIVGRVWHSVEPTCRIRQIRGDGPQRDLIQHLSALRLTETKRAGELRQLLFGSIRIALGQLGQTIDRDAAAAHALRPAQRTRMHLVEECSVVGGQCQIGGGQAAGSLAHDRRQLRIGSGFHAFPAQRGSEFAARFKPCHHRIAGVGQRLAITPQRQRIAAPLGIRLAGGQERGQLCAAQADVVGGLPVGQQRVPVLSTRHCRQPDAAEALGDGLAGIAL